ncbi:MAG: ABC transporter ATP-binding protein, partial [Oscillospiraceae bacterium]|nr:ABC transporter ATP-binding protein [Oscillospiraceae bacterium]
CFLDKTVSEIWELKDGEVHRFSGNYSDYAEKSVQETAERSRKSAEKKERTFTGKTKLKFSYKEQREYAVIDEEIAALEQKIADTETELSGCTSDYVRLQELTAEKEMLEMQLSEKMDRWVYLNDLAERIANGEMV